MTKRSAQRAGTQAENRASNIIENFFEKAEIDDLRQKLNQMRTFEEHLLKTSEVNNPSPMNASPTASASFIKPHSQGVSDYAKTRPESCHNLAEITLSDLQIYTEALEYSGNGVHSVQSDQYATREAFAKAIARRYLEAGKPVLWYSHGHLIIDQKVRRGLRTSTQNMRLAGGRIFNSVEEMESYDFALSQDSLFLQPARLLDQVKLVIVDSRGENPRDLDRFLSLFLKSAWIPTMLLEKCPKTEAQHPSDVLTRTIVSNIYADNRCSIRKSDGAHLYSIKIDSFKRYRMFDTSGNGSALVRFLNAMNFAEGKMRDEDTVPILTPILQDTLKVTKMKNPFDWR